MTDPTAHHPLPQGERLGVQPAAGDRKHAQPASIGIDLFDVGWAQKAADWGVALDFIFPVPISGVTEGGQVREDETRDLGHNLYSKNYARDFTRLATCLA